MTLAGKEFKNIYDLGVEALNDIELQSIEKIKQTKEEHSKNHKKSAEQSLQQLTSKSTLLRSELQQSIDESLKKLETTLNLENTQSDQFVSSLLAEMNILTEQMKMKLKVLKQSHQENVDFASTVASEHYLTNAEEMNFELEQTLARATDNLGAQGKVVLDSLQYNLADKFLQGNQSVDEIIKSTLISSEEHSNTIVDHTVSLLQTLSVNSQNKTKVLESSARDANQAVESAARNLLETVTNHATNIESEINRNYDQISAAHFQNADNRLSNCADELSILHDSTTEQLIELTEEFSADLLLQSTQVQDGLRTRCENEVTRVGDTFGAFKGRLDERLQYSRGQKQALETDKNKLLVAVQNELLSIQKAFAKKIALVLDQSKSELTDVATVVEGQIASAVESFSGQMNVSAQSIQKQIEDEVTRFLEELSNARRDAIAEITSTAKGNLPLPQLSQPTFTDSPSISDEEFLSDHPVLQDDNHLLDETASKVDIASGDISSTENKPRRNRRRKDLNE